MKNSLSFCLLIPLLLVALPIAGRAADSSPTSAPNEEKAVIALITGLGDAFAKKNPTAFAMVFHEDGEYNRVGEMVARGRAAIEEFNFLLLKGAGEGTIPSFRDGEFKLLQPSVRFLRRDVAIVEAPWTLTGGVRNGSVMELRKGLLTFIATKEGEKWGIAVMHTFDFPSGGK